MEFIKTTKHKIAFQIKSFTPNEGGMDEEEFGGVVDTLEDAVTNLELARRQDESEEWLIVCYVETINKSTG